MFASFWHNPTLMRSVSGTLAALALLAIAAAAIHWLTQRPMFAIQTISLAADPALAANLRHVNVPSARAAAMPRLVNDTRLNFFTVDLDAVRRAFENVAWVRRAQVSRVWPNRLLVTVEEHRVLGAWDGNDEGGNDRGNDSRRDASTFVNTFGEAFAVNPAEAEDDGGDDGLPEFAGPAGTEKNVVARYRDFTTRFARLDLKPDRVSLSPRYAWTAHLIRVGEESPTADSAAPATESPSANDGTRAGVRSGAESARQMAEHGGREPQPDPGLTVEFGREIDSRTLAKRLDRLIASYRLVTAKWPRPTLIDLRYPNGFALRAESLRLADPDEKKAARKNSSAKPGAKASAKLGTKPAPNAAKAGARPSAKPAPRPIISVPALLPFSTSPHPRT